MEAPRRLGHIVLVGALTTLAACSAPASKDPAPQHVCRDGVCVDPAAIADHLRDRLDGKVAGFVALVGDGWVVAGGAARRNTDPPALPMTADTMANTASVGKVFTTVVVLESLARRGLDVDTSIADYLPATWGRGPNIGMVTFRDLLTHRSGFRLDTNRVFATDAAAEEQVARGVRAVDHGVTDYNNINFTVVRDLLPQLLGGGGSADTLFRRSVQRDVFEPAGVHSATCALPAHPMLAYPPVGGTGQGLPPPVGPSACSSGGWFMTPADMMRVLLGLERGTVLGGDLQQLMNDGCLGWDDCGTDGSHWKGGAIGDPHDPRAPGFETYFGTTNGVPVVVVINSPMPGVPLPTIVRDAVIAAWQPR